MWRCVVMCTVACLEPNPSPRLQSCVLCPFRGGAMKKCTTGAWCHVACAIWVPEVAFENAVVRVLECVLCVAVWPCDCVAVWLCGCVVRVVLTQCTRDVADVRRYLHRGREQRGDAHQCCRARRVHKGGANVGWLYTIRDADRDSYVVCPLQRCPICDTGRGAGVQCHVPGCNVVMHVLCARYTGCDMYIDSSGESPKFYASCQQHSASFGAVRAAVAGPYN